MKRNSNYPADKEASLLNVTLLPEYGILCISCSENLIAVFFSHNCPPGIRPTIMDITEDPEAVLSCSGTLIRNAERHDHIVASYHPDENCVVVKHKKHIYCIPVPCEVAEIRCGGNTYCFS